MISSDTSHQAEPEAVRCAPSANITTKTGWARDAILAANRGIRRQDILGRSK
jgi:hypothetical protein